jgi:hypothetical protein
MLVTSEKIITEWDFITNKYNWLYQKVRIEILIIYNQIYWGKNKGKPCELGIIEWQKIIEIILCSYTSWDFLQICSVLMVVLSTDSLIIGQNLTNPSLSDQLINKSHLRYINPGWPHWMEEYATEGRRNLLFWQSVVLHVPVFSSRSIC